jgi:hypothetical protein
MQPQAPAELGEVEPVGRRLELGDDPGAPLVGERPVTKRLGAGAGQWVIDPFGFPTLSRPTWPRSTSAKAWETKG